MDEIIELGNSLAKSKGEDSLKILRILESKKITASQLKDKIICKRLLAVCEEYPDDKELSEKIKKVKSILKKRWNSIYN